MKLSLTQLSEIKEFINRKGIKYLDVKMEILDHIATSVEEKMTINSNLEFKDALAQTYAYFGIFGLGGIESSIFNEMGKKYNRIFWKHFWSFFGFTYILGTFLTGYLVYKLLILTRDFYQVLIISLIGAIILYGIFMAIYINRRGYRKLLVHHSSFNNLSIAVFFIQALRFLDSTKEVLIMGIDRDLFIATLVLILFVIYTVSSIKMALKGMSESEKLIQKYKILPIAF